MFYGFRENPANSRHLDGFNEISVFFDVVFFSCVHASCIAQYKNDTESESHFAFEANLDILTVYEKVRGKFYIHTHKMCTHSQGLFSLKKKNDFSFVVFAF